MHWGIWSNGCCRKKEYDHSSGICAYPANHRFRIGIFEQHTGSRGFHPDHQAMGLQNWPAAPQIPYSALLCCNSGRYVYAYRHIDQPGGPRHDARSGPRGFHDVRTGQGRNIHSHRGYALHDLFAAKRLPGENAPNGEEHPARNEESRIVEAVLGPRFPGINRSFKEFDFRTHYGAEIREIRRGGSHFPPRKASRSVRETRWCSIPTEHSFAHGAIRVSF